MYNTYVFESIAAHELEQRNRAAAAYSTRGQARTRRRWLRRGGRQLLKQPSVARGQRVAQGR